MLSQATKYAIRAVLYLAQHSGPDHKIGGKKIASELEVPSPYLAKLLQDLASKQIISSSKGPTGGFYLSDKDSSNRLWDIIEAIDGHSKFEQCFLGLSACDDKNPCPVHHLVAPFKDKILSLFKHKTISILVDEMALENTLISLKGLTEKTPS